MKTLENILHSAVFALLLLIALDIVETEVLIHLFGAIMLGFAALWIHAVRRYISGMPLSPRLTEGQQGQR